MLKLVASWLAFSVQNRAERQLATKHAAFVWSIDVAQMKAFNAATAANTGRE